jgi:hypothetical protein
MENKTESGLVSELRYFLTKVKKFRRYQVETQNYMIKGHYTKGSRLKIIINVKRTGNRNPKKPRR